MKDLAGWLAVLGITLLVLAAFIHTCTSKPEPKWDVSLHVTTSLETGTSHADWVFLCTDGYHLSEGLGVVIVKQGEKGSRVFDLKESLPIKAEPSKYCPPPP